jgi:DNA-directed RNA polymerase I, II, and III subunit RPABC2
MAELQEVEDLPMTEMDESDDEENSLRSSLYGDSDDEYVPPPPREEIDSDDEDFVPPPPPREDTEKEENDDIHSLSSEHDNERSMNVYNMDEDEEEDEEDSDDDDDENYFQKMEQINKKELISNYHPELVTHNNDEVETLAQVVRNEQGLIIDPLHKTVPFLTKYEKARILGERAKQLNLGAKPLVEIGPEIIDGYLIALKEFEQKRIPFIIKRPLPNGGCEYWKFKDLEVL